MNKEYRINLKDFDENKTIKEIIDNLETSSNKHNVSYGIENK
jgi:hypothetical protein